MSAWPRHELRQIAETDGPAHRSVPRTRRTYGTPTWTWSVVVDGELLSGKVTQKQPKLQLSVDEVIGRTLQSEEPSSRQETGTGYMAGSVRRVRDIRGRAGSPPRNSKCSSGSTRLLSMKPGLGWSECSVSS